MGHVFQGHPGIGHGVIEGEALVATDGFSARYDVDLAKGTFSRPAHKLYGEAFRDRIIVLDIAKGGVASAWMLRVLMKSEHQPKALILNWANPIMAQGASFGEMPLIDRFDCDITTVLKTGDRLRITPEEGRVEVV
jgi:predicted aconitase with swiveling domain